MEALRAGIAEGMTHLDTAELYKGSEEVIREAVRGVPRERLFVVSKVLPRNASYAGTLRACDASLQRLGMDHLDAYLLHWWTGDHPIEDTMRAMAELADRGKTRSVGVSNFSPAECDAAQRALGAKHRLACNQVQYHLEDRSIEADLVAFAERTGMALVAYSPFGGPRGGFPRPGSAGHRALEEVGRKHARTPRQVALRFLTRHPSVFAIPKAEQPAHARENAGGQGWQLDEADVAALDAAFPGPRPSRTLDAW
jgi:diketogulonate reductase-like aldo/keto reductase